MKIVLHNKTALVTGSTQGIGRGIALGLAAAGARVYVNGRSPERVDEAVASIRAQVEGADVVGLPADLGTAEGCAALVEALPSCDILVNNVGIFGPQDFFETPDETWQRFFEVNVLSGVRLSRAYLQGMAERGWGRVVFISSESAINIPEDMIHYGFTKTSQLSISRGLAKRMRGTGVTVNAVLPGPTLSAGFRDMLADEIARTGKPAEDLAREFVMANRSASIIQRAASVEEVANMVVYTCSPQASATTGAALRVEGGVVNAL